MLDSMEEKDYDKLTKMSFTDWMRRYRPDGIGRIAVGQCDANMKPIGKQDVITFTEVVCDFCNAEIFPKRKDGTETVIGMQFNNSLCEECTAKQEKES